MTAHNQYRYTDTSEYGLGAAPMQNNYPIAFTSKTLTDVETWYTNIECECLSVVFGLENFTTTYLDATLEFTLTTCP